jgi:hypothetical protein
MNWRIKMENNSPILPIGSIVVTKEGTIPLMIVSRAALFQNNNGQVGYFDYSAVPYPSGITDGEEFAFFNREDVETIIYVGYINSDEQLFSENYDKLVSESGYQRLNL